MTRVENGDEERNERDENKMMAISSKVQMKHYISIGPWYQWKDDTSLKLTVEGRDSEVQHGMVTSWSKMASQ